MNKTRTKLTLRRRTLRSLSEVELSSAATAVGEQLISWVVETDCSGTSRCVGSNVPETQ